MLHYSTEQLATVIALPIVTIILLWTIAIFHKNRRNWGAYDIPIVAILVLSVLRNLTVLSYTLVFVLNQNLINVEYCSIVVWIFNSVHTFQASSLTTLAVIGMFAAKLVRKQQNLKQFLTATHVVYHLFCLTTLCACVGVAAILAQHESSKDYIAPEFFAFGFYQHPCRFMPFQLDIKFNVFIIVLHIFLAIVSVTSFLMICYHHYRAKISSFEYMKKSSSDLSELSLGLSATYGGHNKNYYDTYTIQKTDGGYYSNGVWNSDVSNISTTVSSTNSRRPCLKRTLQKEDDDSCTSRTGLETIHPVLIVCYLFYHLPLIGLCIFPRIIAPWPVSGAALWLGLLQDILIPTGLGLVDTRFCKWVSKVYRCSDRRGDEKLPQVGLDGKFRHFGSQPQSLEVVQTPPERVCRIFQPTEHKFPITNGSLYTSIDGRVPVIHNYRRQNREHRAAHPSLNMGIHATHLRRQNSRENFLDSTYQKSPETYCENCEADLCQSRSNLHHLTPRNPNFSLLNRNNQIPNNNANLMFNNKRLLEKKASLSQGSLSQMQGDQTFVKSETTASQSVIRRNVLRLSKSEDSLNDVHKDLKNFKRDPEAFQKKKQSNYSLNEQLLNYSSSEEEEEEEEEYFTDSINLNENNQNFDTLSSESCYSITTDANCDFEFYQNHSNISYTSSDNIPSFEISEKDENVICMHVPSPSINSNLNAIKPTMQTFKPKITQVQINEQKQLSRSNSRTSIADDVGLNFRITRSNSKRSLKDFQAYVDENSSFVSEVRIQRSNSYVSLEDSMKEWPDTRARIVHMKQKVKSAETLNGSVGNAVYVEEINGNNELHRRFINGNNTRYGGSVPDFKKIFISEYI